MMMFNGLYLQYMTVLEPRENQIVCYIKVVTF